MPSMIKRFLSISVAVMFLACAHAPVESRYRSLEMRLVSEIGGQPFPLWDEAGTIALDPEVLFSGRDFADIESSASGGDDKKTESKPKVDDKAYKAALERIPEPKEKYDPWGIARPKPATKPN